jgi:hypothetical protein
MCSRLAISEVGKLAGKQAQFDASLAMNQKLIRMYVKAESGKS